MKTAKVEMSFGSSNHGWIQFLGGRIRGMINCYGEASSKKSQRRNEESGMRKTWNEWGEYNDQQYEIRCWRARW